MQDLIVGFSRLCWSFQENTMLWILGILNFILSLVVIILLLERHYIHQNHYQELEEGWGKEEGKPKEVM